MGVEIPILPKRINTVAPDREPQRWIKTVEKILLIFIVCVCKKVR